MSYSVCRSVCETMVSKTEDDELNEFAMQSYFEANAKEKAKCKSIWDSIFYSDYEKRSYIKGFWQGFIKGAEFRGGKFTFKYLEKKDKKHGNN